MLYPTAKDWKDWGVNGDLPRLFVLQWAELFGPDSLDTWQVRTTNVLGGLDEVLQCVSRIGEHPPYRHNLPPLLREIDHMLGSDPVARRHFPFAQSFLSQFVVKGAADIDAGRLSETVRALQTHLAEYRRTLVADIYHLLKHGKKEKHDLVRLTQGLATELARCGYSRPYLAQRLSALQSGNTKPLTGRLHALLEQCSCVPHDFVCTFAISWDPKLMGTAVGEHIEVVRGIPAHGAAESESRFYTDAKQTDFFARVRVRALDPFRAREIAAEHLANAFAAITLYRPNDVYEIKGENALVSMDGGVPELVPPDTFGFSYLKDARDVGTRLEKLLGTVAAAPPDTAETLSAAIQYHRTATMAATDEARLVNLWIALECLVGGAGEGSVVDRICRYVPSSIALTNGAKLIRGISIYLRHVMRQGDTAAFLEILPNSKPGYVDPFDVLSALREKRNGKRISGLYKLCGDHPLVCYRLYRVRHHTLGRPTTYRDSLRTHRQNVDWQLRRIYRARNEVMHRARAPVQAKHLIQHLHTYLVLTIYGLVHEMEARSATWGRETALEHRYALFEHYVSLLNKDEGCPIGLRGVLFPEESLRPAARDPAWPDGTLLDA